MVSFDHLSSGDNTTEQRPGMDRSIDSERLVNGAIRIDRASMLCCGGLPQRGSFDASTVKRKPYEFVGWCAVGLDGTSRDQSA
jgi:hypothetical protein